MSLFHIERFDVRCGVYMEEDSVAAKVVDLWAFFRNSEALQFVKDKMHRVAKKSVKWEL